MKKFTGKALTRFIATRLKRMYSKANWVQSAEAKSDLETYIRQHGVTASEWADSIVRSKVPHENWTYSKFVLPLIQPEPKSSNTWGGVRKGAGLANKKKAREHSDAFETLLRHLRLRGYSLGQVAAKLNEKGFKTAQGRPLTKTHVYRILNRSR